MKAMVIAVTGVIGSGKSFVARELARLMEAECCDTDVVCRDLLIRNNKGWQGVIDTWQDAFLDDEKEIDRVKLREAIFTNDEIRKELETILHPFVRQHVAYLIERCKISGKNLVVEVPLLFEVGWQCDFDSVVTVYANRSICLQRIIKRDGVSLSQAEKSFAAQMDIKEKAKRADYVIDNSGSMENTRVQLVDLFDTLSKS